MGDVKEMSKIVKQIPLTSEEVTYLKEVLTQEIAVCDREIADLSTGKYEQKYIEIMLEMWSENQKHAESILAELK